MAPANYFAASAAVDGQSNLQTAARLSRHTSQTPEKWWGRRDSNPRPIACKASALSLSYTPIPIDGPLSYPSLRFRATGNPTPHAEDFRRYRPT
jgi:hypothetical protein